MQIYVKKNIFHIVEEGQTLADVCKIYNVDIKQMQEENFCTNVFEGQILTLTKSYSHVYVVQPLDSKEKIANKFGVDISAIENACKHKSLFIGQKLLF